MQHRRVKVRELADMCKIVKERFGRILHEELHMRRLSARWVPRLLTIDQKRERINISKECLELFPRNRDEFLRRFITVDET